MCVLDSRFDLSPDGPERVERGAAILEHEPDMPSPDACEATLDTGEEATFKAFDIPLAIANRGVLDAVEGADLLLSKA